MKRDAELFHLLGDVLNALRHQRLMHYMPHLLTELAYMCSTPYDIRG